MMDPTGCRGSRSSPAEYDKSNLTADLHLFEQGGVNYLFFPRSAKLYQLSRTAAQMLPALRDTPSPLPASDPFREENQAEYSHLRGALHDLLQREFSVPDPAPPASGESDGKNGFQAFSLYLAQTCNMSCCYCWNRGGSFGNRPRLMSENEARLAIEQIASLAEDSRADQIIVNLYGGEPLLNFAALKKITLGLREREAALGKSFCFTIDTNGCLLQGEHAAFLAQHFTHVGVSLDGRQEIHDRQRPAAGGDRTWRRIVANIRSFPAPKLLGLRATLTAQSDSYLDTFCQLAALGVRRIELEYCHQPGRATPRSYEGLIVPLARQQKELTEFIDYYVSAISHFSDSEEIPFMSNVLESITRLRSGARFTRPCGAGVNMLALDCAGRIFPCIAFVEHPEFSMGQAGVGAGLQLHRSLAQFQVEDHHTCRNCWLRYDCAGGCYAAHYQMTGNTGDPHPDYCTGMRVKGEIYLHALAQMLDKCPWHLDKDGSTARGVIN